MQQSLPEPQVLSNEHVRVSIHRKPACVVEFNVEASQKLIEEADRQAIKRVAKEVVLPGFRKGKAPEALIRSKYEPQILKEREHLIADISFRYSQQLAHIPLLHRDAKVTYKMNNQSHSGALLTLNFETEPTIPSVDPKLMQLTPVKRPEVSPQKIDETIRQIQLFFAQWTAITDRPVQENDFVLLDVDVIEQDPAIPLFKKTRFEVNKTSMAAWMYDLVLGKHLHDSIEGVSVPDEDASAEDKEQLKPKQVRLTIHSIDTAVLPALDDTFVQTIGAKTVEELRLNVTSLLNKQADSHVQEAQREQASAFLLTQYPFDLPKTLVQQEVDFRLNQLKHDKEFITYWESLSKEDRQKTIQTIHEQSEKAVRMFYLCRKVVADAKISVSAQDIPPPASSPLEFLLNPQKMFHHQKNAEVEHAEAFSRLVLEKAEDYLIAHAAGAAAGG